MAPKYLGNRNVLSFMGIHNCNYRACLICYYKIKFHVEVNQTVKAPVEKVFAAATDHIKASCVFLRDGCLVCLNLNINIIKMLSTMTKTLTIRDEVYRKLVSVKGKGESFSELFERLVESRSPSELLKTLRGRIELTENDKRRFLAEVDRRREERRV